MDVLTITFIIALLGLVAMESARPSKQQVVEQNSYLLHCLATVKITTGEGSLGTGFFVDKNGTIATANHVVNGCSDIKVTDYFGKTYVTKVILQVEEIDFALVRIITDGDTPYLTIAETEGIVGDKVTVIGHPLGESYSLSSGVISHTSRRCQINDIGTPYNVQIDAPINGGNSGGPVFNSDGKVIGIVSWAFTGQDGLGYIISCEYFSRWLP